MLKDPSGNLIGFVGITRDISERKKAAEELKLRAELLDGATDAIFLHDSEGNLIYVNQMACRVHGYKREEFMAMNLRELGTPEYDRLMQQRFQELAEKGQAIFETAHFRKDRSILPLEVHSRVIQAGDRKLILTVARDITEHKKAEEQREALLRELEEINSKLQQSNKELQDFAYIASHDLRDPLRKVTSFGTLLQHSLVASWTRTTKKL